MQHKSLQAILTLALLAGATGCMHEEAVKIPTEVAEVRTGILQGYIDSKTLPDSLKIVPPKPNEDSARFAYDKAITNAALKLYKTPRWDLAAKDADLSFSNATEVFECVMGIKVTKEQTPHIYMLLRRTLADAGLSTYGAKNYYKRARPFMLNNKAICTPHEREDLKKDGSYPSGHSAVGWAWALILAEVAPSHADAILARGRAFGQSRVVCNVHWQSDVDEGRIMGAATVAKLHTDPIFLAEIEAAKKEYNALKKDTKVTKNCAQEAVTLKIAY